MEINPDGKLAFSSIPDYEFITLLRTALNREDTLALTFRIRDRLLSLNANPAYQESISREELISTLEQQEIEQFKKLGLAVPEYDYEKVVFSRKSGIVYELDAKWMPLVMAQALLHSFEEEELRDELLKFMIDGQLPELYSKIIADEDEDPIFVREWAADDAQRMYDIAKVSGEIVLALSSELI